MAKLFAFDRSDVLEKNPYEPPQVTAEHVRDWTIQNVFSLLACVTLGVFGGFVFRHFFSPSFSDPDGSARGMFWGGVVGLLWGFRNRVRRK